MNNYPNEKTPKVLYKYRSINHHCENMLCNGEIYFATIPELNDKNEYTFRFKNGGYVRNLNNQLIYLNAQQRTDQMLNSVKKDANHGILSLCESNCEIKMYEEYADNFKGVCIGFDWDQFGLFFDGSFPLAKNFPRKVVYQPLIEADTSFISPGKWIEIFTSKLPEFSFEKEWRMFYKAKQHSHSNIRLAIREIIFGYKVSENHQKLIREMVFDLPWIRFYLMNPLKSNRITCLPSAGN